MSTSAGESPTQGPTASAGLPSAAPPFGPQTTIDRTVTLAGRGLHTAAKTRVRLAPAPPGSGIVFRRPGADGTMIEVQTDWRHRQQQRLCTALVSPDGGLFRTVEHLLASLSAFGIDNLSIEMDGEELPIFDGSATPWCSALIEAGIVEQAMTKHYIRVLKAVEFAADNRWIRVEPAAGRFLSVSMDLRGFGDMSWCGEIGPDTFAREVAPARSFGRLKWALPLKLYHLFSGQPVLRGASLRNVAAIWGDRVIGGMRLPDEPARHRALDLIGDLALAGAPILGRVEAYRPGHDVNYAFVDQMMKRSDAWEHIGGQPTDFS